MADQAETSAPQHRCPAAPGRQAAADAVRGPRRHRQGDRAPPAPPHPAERVGRARAIAAGCATSPSSPWLPSCISTRTPRRRSRPTGRSAATRLSRAVAFQGFGAAAARRGRDALHARAGQLPAYPLLAAGRRPGHDQHGERGGPGARHLPPAVLRPVRALPAHGARAGQRRAEQHRPAAPTGRARARHRARAARGGDRVLGRRHRVRQFHRRRAGDPLHAGPAPGAGGPGAAAAGRVPRGGAAAGQRQQLRRHDGAGARDAARLGTPPYVDRWNSDGARPAPSCRSARPTWSTPPTSRATRPATSTTSTTWWRTCCSRISATASSPPASARSRSTRRSTSW